MKFKRLKGLGHVYRLSKNSPTPTALREVLRKVKKPEGDQIATWVSIVNRQLKEFEVPNFEIAETIAQDRKLGSSLISRTMSTSE